jgi:hypothetical protein
VRISDGVGSAQHDVLPDVRGLALKVMGIDGIGSKLREDDAISPTQDFLSTNGESQVAPNARAFVDFALAQANPDKLAMVSWFLHNPELGMTLLSRVVRVIPTILNESFYSDGAYKLGPRAVRYKYQPCQQLPVDSTLLEHLQSLLARVSDQISQLLVSGDPGDVTFFNYLRDDVHSRLPNGICYDMYVQFQSTADETPIEDAHAVWPTAFYRIAQITIPPDALDRGSEDDCDQFGWQPWHSLEEHRPLGNINRARRIVYDTSRRNRLGLGQNDQLPAEPRAK